ncbi:hypothetical protein MYU51_007691 [Penicillium brevicompactum]
MYASTHHQCGLWKRENRKIHLHHVEISYRNRSILRMSPPCHVVAEEDAFLLCGAIERRRYDTPLNHNATIQTLGRVHRLGLTRQQRTWIFFQDHTIQLSVEYNATKKMLAQLAGDYRLYLEEMSDDNFSIEDRSYKLLAQILGHHPLAPELRHMEDYTQLRAPHTKDEAPPPVKSLISTNSEDSSSDTQDFKSPKSNNPSPPPQHTQTPGCESDLSDDESDSDFSPASP